MQIGWRRAARVEPRWQLDGTPPRRAGAGQAANGAPPRRADGNRPAVEKKNGSQVGDYARICSDSMLQTLDEE